MIRPYSDQQVQTLCLLILTAIVVAASLYWLRPVLEPFVLALFIACGVSPYMNWDQDRLRMPRMLAIASGIGLALMVLTILWSLIWVSVVDLAQNSVTYQSRFNELIERTIKWVPSYLMAADDEEAAVEDGPAEAADGVEDGGAAARAARRDRARKATEDKIREFANYLRQKVGYILLQLSGSYDPVALDAERPLYLDIEDAAVV